MFISSIKEIISKEYINVCFGRVEKRFFGLIKIKDKTNINKRKRDFDSIRKIYKYYNYAIIKMLPSDLTGSLDDFIFSNNYFLFCFGGEIWKRL